MLTLDSLFADATLTQATASGSNIVRCYFCILIAFRDVQLTLTSVFIIDKQKPRDLSISNVNSKCPQMLAGLRRARSPEFSPIPFFAK